MAPVASFHFLQSVVDDVHSFGHGKWGLANLLATLNLFAFTLHTAMACLSMLWRQCRAKVGTRRNFFDQLRFLAERLLSGLARSAGDHAGRTATGGRADLKPAGSAAAREFPRELAAAGLPRAGTPAPVRVHGRIGPCGPSQATELAPNSLPAAAQGGRARPHGLQTPAGLPTPRFATLRIAARTRCRLPAGVTWESRRPSAS